jgi:hypothetical protein
MKRIKGGALSIEQKQWIADLKSLGYKVSVCKGAFEAQTEISNYLGLDPKFINLITY